MIVVKQPVPEAFVPAPGLMGAVAEVDITPPPGLPTHGFGSVGVCETTGYWLRLKARILVLRAGERQVVLVQTDLGASSALLHRRVAMRLADQGVSPDNLLLAATHTHGGPGGFFGDKFYNRMVSARPAFIPGYLVQAEAAIEAGVRDALSRLAPAAIGGGVAKVEEGAVHNRSLEAWRTNHQEAGLLASDAQATEREVFVLRLDVADGPGGTMKPAGLFATLSMHGTAMGPAYPLYHGDVHGYASRLAAHAIATGHDAPGFVAAVAAGSEGDQSPGPEGSIPGRELLRYAGTAGAKAIVEAFDQAGRSMFGTADVTLRYQFEEVSLRGASTSRGPLCDEAVLGGPQAAGSEIGRGPTFGFFEMVEGITRAPDGCQARKTQAGGALQSHFFTAEEFPDIVPFQVIMVGQPDRPHRLTLGTVPGEPTAEVGREVQRLMSRSIKEHPATSNCIRDAQTPEEQRKCLAELVGVVAVANGYATYFTTPSEFQAQHYEGGATLYGPMQGIFAAERLGAMTGLAIDSATPVNAYAATRWFQAGEAVEGIWPTQACHSAWDLVDQPHDAEGAIRFTWTGSSKDDWCGLPRVSVECRAPADPSAAVDRLAPFQKLHMTDDGIAFEVTRAEDIWAAAWTAPPEARGRTCAFVVTDALGTPRLTSATFEVSR